jgi:putative transposase
MTIARHQQIHVDSTPYYHCTTRCVRRAFLCGNDRYTGKNFDHRKEWLEQRLITLSRIFAIDLLAYAVMSNHYHVVVRIDTEKALSWSNDEVVERWAGVYTAPNDIDADQIETWRNRLASLSWFMRSLNEPMARTANREDRCKGRFWEGRFHSQALLDESALLRCMAYVDLNPIRAADAITPETSMHTSIKARIEGRDDHLVAFNDAGPYRETTLSFGLHDYLQLVDWSGRQFCTSKLGRTPRHIPPILERLDIADDDWLNEMRHYGRWYYRAVGSFDSMQRYCQHLGQRWLKGAPKPVRAPV